MDTLVLFLILWGMLSVFAIENNVYCKLIIYGLYLCWGRFLLCPFFWRVLTINTCWILSKAFSASIEMFIWFLFVNMVYHINWFSYIEESCICGINTTWLWCCWILFAKILLRIFASMFMSDTGLWFSFFVLSLSGFGIRVMVAL